MMNIHIRFKDGTARFFEQVYVCKIYNDLLRIEYKEPESKCEEFRGDSVRSITPVFNDIPKFGEGIRLGMR